MTSLNKKLYDFSVYLSSQQNLRLLVGLTMLLLLFPQVAVAQESDTSAANHIYLPVISADNNQTTVEDTQLWNGADPNYVFTPEQLQRITEKDAAAQHNFEENFPVQDGVFAAYLKGSKELSVGTWKEPNDYAHRNYCGPGATQVALDAKLPATSVPSVDTLGTEEGTDPNSGTYMNKICSVLNTRLNTAWYEYSVASVQSTMTNWFLQDIDNGYGFVTGVKTGVMPGWSGRNINHIVTAYGYANVYVETSGTYGDLKYTETSGSVAGYTGTYRQTVSLATFWGYVSGNSAQCW